MTTSEIRNAAGLAVIYAEDGARESAIAVLFETTRRLEADNPVEAKRIRDANWRPA